MILELPTKEVIKQIAARCCFFFPHLNYLIECLECVHQQAYLVD